TYDRMLFSNLNLNIGKGEKIAIIGTNGIGKTTLLKCLLKIIEPDSGNIKWGESVTASYFAQDHRENIDKDADSLTDWLYRDAPKDTDTTVIRSVLGRMLFSGDMALKSTSVLSGGERSRLIIASMILREDNLLALDEPTNHLDLESIEALNYALSIFEGTVLFVSHDREFVSSLATRIIEITTEGINDFSGTYEEYLEKEGGDFYKRLSGGAILDVAKSGSV
ncbi:MAG: ATP-binding cassette domain-containing protein, partial [Spirochaetia bacterium]|nr:ATP-binding cassette domain-containing protein [Spirochaetia bacterium]